MFVLESLFMFVVACHATEVGFADSSIQEKKICIDGYFQCANDTLCVPQHSMCDKKFDCPSGSDEEQCEDEHDDAYYDHIYRKRPAAEHDDLNKTCSLTYNKTFACICQAKDLLCQNLNLTIAPNYIPAEFIDILDFSGNNFRRLSADSLKTVPNKIEQLILRHCNILNIEQNAFFNLTSIRKLYLDNNDMKRFPANLFKEGNMLQFLAVSYNDITQINPDAFVNLKYLDELDLRGNKLEEIPKNVFEPLEHLTTLFLQNNRIKYIYASSFPKMSLEQLSLMENKIISIEHEAFANLKYLKSLFLSNNRLTELRNGTFMNLHQLEALTLNDNFIKEIELGVFVDVLNLKSLKLEHNQFRMLDKKVLLPLKKLPHIYFDRFEMCASATHVRNCYPKGDGISSQDHLLDNSILRASVWIMGAIGCIGNIVVVLGRFLAPTNNIVHSLYLQDLALSDLLMGIYLLIIACVDYQYRGVYLMHQYKWRHSYLCNLCGFLSTLSCESSVLILTLVTWDRFISVTQPLARKQPSPKAAGFTIFVLWLVAVIVSSVPLFHITSSYFGDEFYGNNGVCLSLHIHEPYSKGWEYSAAMFILVNALALVFICYAYLRMIKEIKASGVACRSTRQSQERDKVAKRFGVIVFTDCMCWVPIIIVKLTALFGVTIPENLYAWLAIFILPIHSALNPVLYTLTTTIFKKQVRKVINTCLYKRKRPDHVHSASESGFSLSFGVFPKGGSSRRFLSYRGTQSSIQ